MKDIVNERDRRDAPESLRAVTHTASTIKGCRIALSTGPVLKLCFGCVRRVRLPAPWRSYLVARSSKSQRVRHLSACCLIRNKITADFWGPVASPSRNALHTTGHWYGYEHTHLWSPMPPGLYLFGVHKPCVPLHAETFYSLALCHEALLHKHK